MLQPKARAVRTDGMVPGGDLKEIVPIQAAEGVNIKQVLSCS